MIYMKDKYRIRVYDENHTEYLLCIVDSDRAQYKWDDNRQVSIIFRVPVSVSLDDSITDIKIYKGIPMNLELQDNMGIDINFENLIINTVEVLMEMEHSRSNINTCKISGVLKGRETQKGEK